MTLTSAGDWSVRVPRWRGGLAFQSWKGLEKQQSLHARRTDRGGSGYINRNCPNIGGAVKSAVRKVPRASCQTVPSHWVSPICLIRLLRNVVSYNRVTRCQQKKSSWCLVAWFAWLLVAGCWRSGSVSDRSTLGDPPVDSEQKTGRWPARKVTLHGVSVFHHSSLIVHPSSFSSPLRPIHQIAGSRRHYKENA